MSGPKAQGCDLRESVTAAERLEAEMNVFCAGDTASGVTLPRSLRDAAVALLLLPVWRMGAAQTGQCDISATSLLHGRSGPARMSAVGRRPGHGRGQHKGGASTMRPVRLP